MSTSNPIFIISSHDGTNSKLTHNLAVSSLRTSRKLLVFTARGYKFGIDKYIKINSDKKLKKLFQYIMRYIIFSQLEKTTLSGRNCIYYRKLEEFSSANPQSCDGHTVSLVIYIHKKLNWTHNCHASAICIYQSDSQIVAYV